MPHGVCVCAHILLCYAPQPKTGSGFARLLSQGRRLKNCFPTAGTETRAQGLYRTDDFDVVGFPSHVGHLFIVWLLDFEVIERRGLVLLLLQ